jgi:hypothetical protein
MQPSTQAQIYRDLRQRPTWMLLAAANAPVVMSLIQTHLPEGSPRLPASLLVERIARDLELLRADGFDLPQGAGDYLADWLAAGWLERSLSTDGEEIYEQSAAAVRAIRFTQGLIEQRSVATESRLGLVISELVKLSEETEGDPQARIEHLLRERERIDSKIEAVRTGHLAPLSADRALERLREILALSADLAADFRRLREDFRTLNQTLREQIVESEGSRAEVLEAVFADLDLIADSEAGTTFRAFWRLLTDPRGSAELESALTAVLGRDFANRLERPERRALYGLTGTLLERGGEVHEVLYQLARGLKQFVQSREYREQRRISRLVKTAQRQALALKGRVRPQSAIGRDLELTSAGIRSVSQLRLHDPSLDAMDGRIDAAEGADIPLSSIALLVSHSEIDFRTLEDHIADLLQGHEQITVADLLARFPAEQGLGSLVGYLAIGVRKGVVSEGTEGVAWRGLDGVERAARIPRIFFLRAKAQGADTSGREHGTR